MALRKMKFGFAIMMSIVLTLVLFGCSSGSGNKQDSGNNGADNASKNTGTNNTQGSEAGGETGGDTGGETGEEAIDLQGRTITIAGWWDGTPNANTESAERELKRWEAVEKKYNVKLQFQNISYEQFQQQFTTGALADQQLGDIVYLEMFWVPLAVNGGLLTPLDDYLDWNYWPQNMGDWGGFKGNMYAMAKTPHANRGIFYNKTIFQNEGIPDPQTLVENGEWTWDKFLEVTRQLTKDVDGDGITDQYGYYGVHYMMGEDFILANGGNIIEEQDGKYVSGLETEKGMEALRFIHELMHVHRVSAPIPPEERFDAFINGRVAMRQAGVYEGAQTQAMQDEFGFTYFPKGPSADNYVSPVGSIPVATIPAGVENPEILVKIFEEISAPVEEWLDNDRAYFETQLRGEDDIMNALGMREHIQLFNYFGFDGVRKAFVETLVDIVDSGATPETAVEQRKLEMQTAIDEIFNR